MAHTRSWISLVMVAGLAACRSYSSPEPSSRAALLLTADSSLVAPLGPVTLSVSGGVPPYAVGFSAQGYRSGGTVAAQGTDFVYVAGTLGGVTDSLLATDAVGTTSATVNISVGPALTLAPPSASVAVGTTLALTAAGGAPPIAFGLSTAGSCDGGIAATPGGPVAQVCLGDGGSCISAAGIYVAGAASAQGTDWVTARDANGACAISRLSVGSALQFDQPVQAASPGQSLFLTLSGGSPPYTVAFDPHGNLSGGSVSEAGQYQAGPNANLTDLLWAVDAVGNRAPMTVVVGDPEVALPSQGSFELLSGDFNGDAITDLVAISNDPHFPTLVVTLGGATVSAPLETDPTYGTAICGAAVGDINGDGLDDVILSEVRDGNCDDTYPGAVQTYLGSPSGALGLGPRLDILGGPWAATGGVAAIPWGAGPDVLAVAVTAVDEACVDCDRVVLFLDPRTPGTFTTELGSEPLAQVGSVSLPAPAGQGSSSSSILSATADYYGPSQLWVVREPFAPVTCQDGYPVDLFALFDLAPLDDGGWRPVLASDAGHANIGCLDTVTLRSADLDLDGRADLEVIDFAVQRSSAGVVDYRMRQGTTFGPLQSFPIPNGSYAADVGYSPRYDGSELDIVGRGVGGRWTWFADAGALLPAPWSGLGDDEQAVCLGDVNNDETWDASVIDNTNHLHRLLGTADGNLEQERLFAYTGPASTLAASGDFDGDGHDDVLGVFDGLSVYLGVAIDGGSPALATGPVFPLTGLLAFDVEGSTVWLATERDDGRLALQQQALFASVGPPLSIPLKATIVTMYDLLLLPTAGAVSTVLVDGFDSAQGGEVFELVTVSADGGAVESAELAVPPFTAGVALLDLQGQGARDLAVTFSPDGVALQVAAFLYQPGAAVPWTLAPAMADGGFSLPVGSSDGFDDSLGSFAAQVGGVPDHLVGRYNEAGALPDGGTLNISWVAAVHSDGSVHDFAWWPFATDGDYLPASTLTNFAATDLDGDGNTDLVIYDQHSTLANVLLADGQGGFTPISFLLPGPGVALLTGNFGADPLAASGTAIELALIREDTPQIQLLRNTGGFIYQ